MLDGIGSLPSSKSGGLLLFHLIVKLDEKTSRMITTKLTLGESPPLPGDGKMTTVSLDRVTHCRERIIRIRQFQRLSLVKNCGTGTISSVANFNFTYRRII